MFDRFWKKFGRNKKTTKKKWNPDIPWIEAADNPWGVRVLDVRPVTHNVMSVTTERSCAENAVSFYREDGLCFVGVPPETDQTLSVDLRYPIDGHLYDGVLYRPSQQEHKWAIFFHDGKIIFVRSWLRKVAAVADVQFEGSEMIINAITGSILGQPDLDQTAFNERLVDFLIRTHVIGLDHPVPLPMGIEKDARKAADWCFSCFGNKASYATHELASSVLPDRPLRSISMLHIAAARADAELVQRLLDEGVYVDAPDQSGTSPLYWSLVHDDVTVAELLLSRGAKIDQPDDHGVTALMALAQKNALLQTKFLLEHGADPNIKDGRGFVALHRAADGGHVDIIKLLLEWGAAPNVLAMEHTPVSMATQRGHDEAAKVLSEAVQD